MANLAKFYGGVTGVSPECPVPTVTAVDHNALQVAHLEEIYGNSTGCSVAVPLQTVTTHDHHGVVVTKLEAADGADFRHWPEIREMLNRYCGYALAADELILFRIGVAWYFMADIGLRMLTPRELYRAQGFPDDYIIDRDASGRAYPKNAQVARCGNAVPPPFAAALVRANFPEWCAGEIASMRELAEIAAVQKGRGKMGKRIPIPPDFRELAPGTSTAELAEAYGCSDRTVRNWRRQCGIPPPKQQTGFHKGTDTPEQIQYCLRCPIAKCYGEKCPILPKVRKRKRKEVTV